MFGHQKYAIVLCILFLICSTLCFSPINLAQDETNDAKIIERYKLMLSRKPKEGSTFDRLYQFYLEGDGLEKMVADYQAEVQAKPNDPNVQLILGHIYKRLGKDKEALTAYQRGVELAPNNYYAYFALGQLYVTLRQHEDAIRELAKAVTFSEQSQSVSPEELTEIYKTLGHAYFSRDKLDDAIKAWKKISELDPQNVFARIELADLFREKELYPQAIAQHQAIIDTKKDDPYRRCLSLREIGKIHEDTGAYQKAREHYDKALSLTATGNWLRKDLQHRIIAIYAADANWKDLITYYQDKLKANPNDPELLGLLAAAYIENQQLEEGTDTYRKGLERAPTDTGLRLSLITALRNAEKFADAAAEYESLSEQQPDNFGIYRELGKLYLQLENEDKAKAVYQRMIDQDPQNASTHLTLAEIYTGHEWMEDAAAAYQQAISLAPQNLDYIEYFGEFYFRQGNREKAVETWDQMVADDKRTAENYDRLARLLEAKKFSTEAIDASKKAVELMPDAYRFREALAKRLMSNKQYDEALLEYNEAIKLAPNDFFAEQMDDQRIELYRQQGTLVEKIEAAEGQLNNSELADADKFAQLKRLAKMYLKSNNTTYALEILLKAKALQPNDVAVNRETANLYTKQGRRDEAIAIYTHLTDIDSTNAREYHANIANAYLKGMDFEAAIDAAKQVIAHSPRNPEGHQLLAQIAKQSGDSESAIESFKQAIRLRPEAIEIRSELASVYNLAGNTRQAIAQYWRCWELSDNISDKLSFIKPLTEAYYDLGRRGELEEKLKQMAKSNTSGVGPVLALAQVYRIEGDLSKAQFQLARALDRQRENAELLSQLVDISLDLGDIQEALTYQQRLVKANPDPIHQQKLGELLFDVGREQEAVQAWSKVLHAKNQTLEAEVKLARLLIRHGLLEEALFALDSAAEKISGKDAHLALYQIGVTLVEINESERAIPHFQRIIAMSEPVSDPSLSTTTDTLTTNVPYAFYGPPGINTNKLNLASALTNRIRPQQYSVRSRTPWIPNTFEEAQAAALVQLKTILEDNGQLNDLISQFEGKVSANSKDVHTLELLGQLYTLIDNLDKTDEIVDQLVAASPNNLVYQGIKLGTLAMRNQLKYDSFKNQLDKMTGLTTDARNWYISEYAVRFYHQGNLKDAEKLLNELEGVNLSNLSNRSRLLDVYVQMGKVDAAERIISRLPASTTAQFSHQYSRIYESISNTFLREGHIDKAVEFFWKYIETTNPSISNVNRVASLAYTSHYSGSHRHFQTNFPSPTTYLNQTRLEFLQKFFNNIWISDQQDMLYATLQEKYNAASGKDRIYPGLAISYCNWWDGKRDKALEVLHSLQKEFPEDLTLKLNTIFVSIQSGKHDTAIELLKELTHADPRNFSQYYNLTLQLAMHTGNTTTVRELMTSLLNSPTGVRELFDFSKKLQSGGLTQYAIAVSKKTTDLAMTERDPNFLRQLSQHLKNLGRGQDAAHLIERAARFENLSALSGQALPTWNTPSTTLSARQQKLIREREAKLVKIADKNPTSFKAQKNLAMFYKSRKQLKEASKAYEAALELKPDDGTMRRDYASMLQQSGQVKKAITQLSILLKEHFHTLQQGSYYYENIIQAFIQAGETNQLVSIAKDMIDENTQYGGKIEFVRRVAYYFNNRIKNTKLALEIYEKIHESGLDYTNYELVSAYVATGKREKAIELLRDKLKTGPVESQVQAILRLSEFNEAIDAIENLTTEYEANFTEGTVDTSMLYLLSILKILTDDIEGSDLYVDKLLKDIPTGTRLRWLNTIANTYRRKSDSERELRLLEAAIEKVDVQDTWQLSDTYQKLGTIYAKKGAKEKAQNAIRKMGTLRLMRRTGGSVYWEKESVARTYMEHGMWDEAEVLLMEIINDLSTQHYDRERAQEQLMTIKINRGELDDTSEGNDQKRPFNIGFLRSKAQQHMNRRQFSDAIKTYEQIIKAVPEDLESQSKLASLYTQENEHDKAIEMWQTLLKSDPANTKYQDGFVNAYRGAGKIEEAIRLSQEYINSDPDIGLHYVRLAQLYIADHQTDDAIITYKKAIELSPGDSKSYEELAKLYLEKGELDVAEKSFKEALKYVGQGRDRRNIEHQMLQLYQRQGKLEEVLKKAEEQGTLTFDMQKKRAEIYQSNGELEKAAKAYKKSLELSASTYVMRDVQSQLMDIYTKLGKLEEFLKEAEEQGTLTFDMQKKRARIYQNKGELEKAAKAYKKALEMTTELHYRRQVERDMMNLFRQSGKMEEFLKEAEKDGTITFEMQKELADYYMSRREAKKAVEALEKARNMTTEEYEQNRISMELIQGYAILGNNEKAVELYEKLSQPNSNSSRSYGTSYSSATGFTISSGDAEACEKLIEAYKQLRKLDQLEAIFKSKLEKEPDNITILHMVAEIYRNSNKHKEAAEAYQTLCKVEPGNIHHFYHAAASLNRIGQAEQANEFLNKGNEALSSSPSKNNPTLLSSLGSICYASKMYTPAIAHFKEAVKFYKAKGADNYNRWQQQHLYELLGKSYLATKQYVEAVEAYQQMADTTTSSYEKEKAEKGIQQAYKEGSLHEKQIPEQLKKVNQNPDDVDARVALAKSYEMSEKFDDAIAQYQKISELQPDIVKWHKTVGDLYEKSTQTTKSERLEKAAAAYKKAIALEPDSYELYNLLAQTYTKNGDTSKAETIYQKALEASLTPQEYDFVVKAIIDLYDAKKQTDKRLAILEGLKTKTEHSALLHKLLGDTYIEAGDMDKAAAAYKKWVEIPSDESNQGVRAQEYFQLAEELLNENVLLDVALELAKRAAEIRSEPVSFSTLGHAYLANEQYDKALEQLQRSLNLMNQSGRFGAETEIKFLLTRLSQIGKNVKDKPRYIEMMGKLINVIPDNLGNELQANLSLAEFCRELGMTDKAKTHILKTGFFPETAWLTLGPFDNTKGVGYNTAYIPEETTQIDAKVKYDGALGQVAWKQGTDETFDGFFSFGDAENYHAAYAWITFTSPEERKAQIRFDSDDQGKVWLNGKKVYAHRRTRGAQVDRRTIPVTLIAGQNTILVKVCNESLPWGFYLRITNTKGTPFDDLKLVTQ
ncbi:hypothetical protein C6501_10760 [Candidatus Poribacteria bacterium]|nr:MAG: hypothetical protein C6501_10760 [Candidatus Poribacteria bacterium]